MQSYRCPNGHCSSLEWGEDLKKVCPDCGVTMYKYRDIALDVVPSSNTPEIVSDHPNAQKRRNAIIVGICGITAIALLYGYNQHYAPPPKAVAVKRVLPSMASGVSAPAVARNILSEVAISELTATVTEQGSVSASFILTNAGGPENDYPSLKIRWKDSAVPDRILDNKAYAHPDTPFTRLPVTVELVKPADATGVEIDLQY